MITLALILAGLVLAGGGMAAFMIIRKNRSNSSLDRLDFDDLRQRLVEAYRASDEEVEQDAPPPEVDESVLEALAAPEEDLLPAVAAPVAAPVEPVVVASAPAPKAAPVKRQPKPLTEAQAATRRRYEELLKNLKEAFDGRRQLEVMSVEECGGYEHETCGFVRDPHNCETDPAGFAAVGGKVVAVCGPMKRAILEVRKLTRNTPYVYEDTCDAAAALESEEKREADKAARNARIEAYRVRFADPEQADSIELPAGATATDWYVVDRGHGEVLVKGLTKEMLSGYIKADKPFGRYYPELGEANRQAAYLRHKPRDVNRPKRIDETAVPVEKVERTPEKQAQHAANMKKHAAQKAAARAKSQNFQAEFDKKNPRAAKSDGQKKGKGARA